ncbi:hypothetical protein [Phaeacidiphilus oryzae]|uniref:hypothetical protein n=1 Tax=Phaeacidiphilus oryzae TaxID=348818 RepID=UPI00068FF970|nr:hypothetical protein [Phaeacidiphilus oryzae]
MGDSVLNVVLGVVSSAVSAALAWTVQRGLLRRRLERKRAFFGLRADSGCTTVLPRHMSGTEVSVNRRDVLAVMELAALIRECGARADVVGHDQVTQGLGGRTEFCVGGPAANNRTAAHLRWKLPGVRMERGLEVGGREYLRSDEAEYALLARITAGEGGRPTFLVCGQSAIANLAAARWLSAQYRRLAHRYGTEGTFCLLLKVVQPSAYGADVVELLGDVTREATARPPAAKPGRQAPEPGPEQRSASAAP